MADHACKCQTLLHVHTHTHTTHTHTHACVRAWHTNTPVPRLLLLLFNHLRHSQVLHHFACVPTIKVCLTPNAACTFSSHLPYTRGVCAVLSDLSSFSSALFQFATFFVCACISMRVCIRVCVCVCAYCWHAHQDARHNIHRRAWWCIPQYAWLSWDKG